MSSASLPTSALFPNGARWVRADFHLHTLAETDPSREFRAEYRDSGTTNGYRWKDYLKDWFDRLNEGQIKVAVITNHNRFDYEDFKPHASEGRRRGILVLPGVELNVNSGGGLHTLIVFSDGWLKQVDGQTLINRFLTSQFPGDQSIATPSKENLPGIFKALEEFQEDYFVIFAHVQSSNGLMNELKGNTLEATISQCGEHWKKRVLGLQKVTDLTRLAQRWPQGVPVPAFVHGSDPRRMKGDESVGSGAHCFIKIGDLTFDSVRFALTDHVERVSETPETTPQKTRLTQVSFQGGALHGVSLPLSSQLTALIGSRGSGKSTVVECIRYALNLDVGAADESYKNGLVKAMLGNGGTVVVEGVDEHGQNFTISRSVGFDPRVVLEGKEARLHPRVIVPGVLYFGQKDLGSRHEAFESEFFNQLTGGLSPQEAERIDSLAGAVKKAVDEYRAVLQAREQDNAYADEEETLRVQLQLYQAKGVEARLQEMTIFDADKRELHGFGEKLVELRQDLGSNLPTFERFEFDYPILKSTELSEVGRALGDAIKSLGTLHQDYNAFIERFDAMLESIRSVIKQVAEKEQSLQDRFVALQQEVNAPGLDLQKYRAQKSRYDQLVKLRRAAVEKLSSADNLRHAAISAARHLHDYRRQLHLKEEQSLRSRQEVLPEEIKLKCEFQGDRSAFEAFLRAKLQGKGFRNASYPRVLEAFRDGLALFERSDEIDAVLEGSADVAKLKEAMEQQMTSFLTVDVPARKEILFGGDSIQNLSLGQRATALLMLLMSLESHPVIIMDQPEDDLDNETIFQRVVKPLLQRKKRVQFIIATHNPNVPVLGDAELVHACREQKKGVFSHQSGSLDSKRTRDSIVEIMEGGEDAFEQRQRIYRQWTS